MPANRASTPPERSRRRCALGRREAARVCDVMAPQLRASNLEVSRILRLDLIGLFLHGRGIVLHQFDVLEGPAAVLVLDLAVEGTQATPVDHQLLAVDGEHEALQQPGGIGVGRILHQAGWADDQWGALAWIDDLDGLALFLELDQVVLVAIRHDGAFAESQFLRRVGRGLHLHDLLLAQLLEVGPADVARYLVGRGHDGAAVTGMRLHDLARPLRIEQIGEALGRLVGFDQFGVVADHAQPNAPAGEQAVRIDLFGGIVARDILGHVGGQDALTLPDDKVRRIRTVDDVDGMDVARVFLANALKNAFAAGTLDAHGDAWIFRLERLGDAFGDRQIDGGIPDNLALLFGRLHELRRDGRGGYRGPPGARHGRGRQCGDEPLGELATADRAHHDRSFRIRLPTR